MTKATYKRQHLIGGLFTISEGESVTIIVWSVATDGLVWCWTSSWEITCWNNQETERVNWEWCGLLKPQNPFLVTHLQQSHTSQSFPNRAIFKCMSLWGSFSPINHNSVLVSFLSQLEWFRMLHVPYTQALCALVHNNTVSLLVVL